MRKVFSQTLQIVLPLVLSAVILYWMYRGFDWSAVERAVESEMSWTWMWLSMPFGVAAQVLRALRWRQMLRPMGERPRLTTSLSAIFLSYASSLVVPRVGELLRCGVLKRYDGVSFSRSLGTVVAERVVDMAMILLLTLATVASQIPVFAHFLRTTGVSMGSLLAGFSLAGYAVAGVSAVALVAFGVALMRRLGLWGRAKSVVSDLLAGLLSIRLVRNKALFLTHSVLIWVSYYLHFYLTFFCFRETCDLGPTCALVAFVVGSFAVLVPTPNGAGPWHFAVKTVLVLYGVGSATAALYVLIVHTLQTLLVVVLGLVALVALPAMGKRALRP